MSKIENDSNFRVPMAGYMILGENQYYSKDTHKTLLNNNVLGVGSSGAGKTRNLVMPNLLQAEGESFVVSDPKGALLKTVGPYLESKGYEIINYNFIHPENSIGYNPIVHCKTTSDIMKLSHIIVYELNKSSGKGRMQDPFWEDSAVMLFNALIGYLIESDDYSIKEKNIVTLSSIIVQACRDGQGNAARTKSPMDEIMENHKYKMHLSGKESWAYKRYIEYKTAPDKTHQTINMTALTKLVSFDTIERRKMLSRDDFNFTDIVKKPTAIFVEVSDTDRSMDAVVNLFYSQMMNELCDYADEKCEGNHLPIPVHFILDDFATNARIDNFQNIISNIRSRWISAMILVQSEAQLEAGYGMDAQTIIDNCNSYVYMGGSSPEMAERIAKRANKSATTILNMPLSTSWVFRRGQDPVLCRNFDIEAFMKVKGFEPGKPEIVVVEDKVNNIDCVGEEWNVLTRITT